MPAKNHDLHGSVSETCPLANILRPDESDYFVLKPKHSAFFSKTLDTLLEVPAEEIDFAILRWKVLSA